MSKQPESMKPKIVEEGELSEENLDRVAGGVVTRSGIQMTLDDQSSSTPQTTSAPDTTIKTRTGILIDFDDSAP